MFGIGLGMVVEASVAVLLAVTIGYCVILNARLKRLHADRETLQKMVGDLMQATALANAAVMELKTAAARTQMQAEPMAATPAKAVETKSAPANVEPQSRLASALQQLAMRPGIGGRAA